MPVILAPEDWPTWLGEREADHDELRSLLKPAPKDMLHLWPVSKRVGSVNNNDASLSEPVALAEPSINETFLSGMLLSDG